MGLVLVLGIIVNEYSHEEPSSKEEDEWEGIFELGWSCM